MPAMTKFNIFTEDLAEGVHDFATDTIMVALVPDANDPVATNSLLSELTQIDYTNLSSSRVLALGSSGQNPTATYRYVPTDLTLTAGPATAPGFRYVVVYNSTATGKTNPLIGWLDYGSDLVLLNTESLVIDFTADGLFTVT